MTWADLDTHVREIGKGLLALGFGPGVAAALLADTRPELVYADLAILGCGGISIALHPDDDAGRVRDVLRETNAAVVVVEVRNSSTKSEYPWGLPRVAADCHYRHEGVAGV